MHRAQPIDAVMRMSDKMFAPAGEVPSGALRPHRDRPVVMAQRASHRVARSLYRSIDRSPCGPGDGDGDNDDDDDDGS